MGMPIKFRCPHCRQFLGVSRAKAGSLADCPSCGRSIRIPQLDGRVEKVPAPQLNLNNTGLRKALDSLAQLAGSDGEVAEVETYADEQAEMPVPKPEPEPSVPLVSTGPHAIEEDFASSAPEVESFVRRKAETEEPLFEAAADPSEASNGRVATVHPPVVVEAPRSIPAVDALTPSLAALAQLAEAPAPIPSQRTGTSASAARTSAPNVESRPVATAPAHRPVKRSITSLVVTSLVSLLIGGGIGAFVMQSLNEKGSGETAGESLTSASRDDDTPAIPVGPVGLTGRVNYVDHDGQSRPDAGSRVLVLPADREGTALLPAEAFRSGANAADRRVAEAALAAIGGAFVTVDDSGEYSASLPSPTRFHVLILSQHMANDLQGGHASELLEDYVDRPSALLGRVAWTVVTIRHQGSGSQSVDHTFVPPQGQ